jgi:DNA-binding transcriptional LysR family regulator
MKQVDIRSLDLAMLRTFEALMQERSVSRAAGRLFLSQPAVSASLARLREVFGDPLFTRTPQGIAPTAQALALLPEVTQILASVKRLLSGVQAFEPATSTRVFRIAGSDHASRLVLARLSELLTHAGSGIRIFWDRPDGTVAHRLNQGELDLGIIAQLETPTDIRSEVLYRDEYVVALRKQHPLAAGPITFDAFCQLPQVFLGYGNSTLEDRIDACLARAGRTRLAQIAVRSFDQMVFQLRHSDHAAVLGRRVAEQFPHDLVLHPVPFDLAGYELSLCWASQADGDQAIRWLREQVLACVAEADSLPTRCDPQLTAL